MKQVLMLFDADENRTKLTNHYLSIGDCHAPASPPAASTWWCCTRLHRMGSAAAAAGLGLRDGARSCSSRGSTSGAPGAGTRGVAEPVSLDVCVSVTPARARLRASLSIYSNAALPGGNMQIKTSIRGTG